MVRHHCRKGGVVDGGIVDPDHLAGRAATEVDAHDAEIEDQVIGDAGTDMPSTQQGARLAIEGILRRRVTDEGRLIKETSGDTGVFIGIAVVRRNPVTKQLRLGINIVENRVVSVVEPDCRQMARIKITISDAQGGATAGSYPSAEAADIAVLDDRIAIAEQLDSRIAYFAHDWRVVPATADGRTAVNVIPVGPRGEAHFPAACESVAAGVCGVPVVVVRQRDVGTAGHRFHQARSDQGIVSGVEQADTAVRKIGERAGRHIVGA